MRIRVTQRAETVIIFLASGIPQSQLNVLAVDFNIGNIVLKNGRDVHLCVLLSDYVGSDYKGNL